MKKIDIVQLITREMKQHRATIADVARSLNIAYPSAHQMLHRKTLQVHRLIELSEALQYNFFREIAALLPYKNPELPDTKALQEKSELEEQVKKLELEVSILRQTIRDMAGAK
jgi:transposase-like protein